MVEIHLEKENMILFTTTTRSSTLLSSRAIGAATPTLRAEEQAAGKKKYSIGSCEPLCAELGRQMGSFSLLMGQQPAPSIYICPHRVPPDADSSSPIEDEMTKLRLLQGEITMEIGSQAACGVATSSEQARQVCEG